MICRVSAISIGCLLDLKSLGAGCKSPDTQVDQPLPREELTSVIVQLPVQQMVLKLANNFDRISAKMCLSTKTCIYIVCVHSYTSLNIHGYTHKYCLQPCWNSSSHFTSHFSLEQSATPKTTTRSWTNTKRKLYQPLVIVLGRQCYRFAFWYPGRNCETSNKSGLGVKVRLREEINFGSCLDVLKKKGKFTMQQHAEFYQQGGTLAMIWFVNNL